MGSAVTKQLAPEVMSRAKDVVTKQIKSNKVVVFSKTYCPYCTKAKRALAKVGLPASMINVIELDQVKDVDGVDTASIQAALGELTGATSVPRVFLYDGTFIGGGDDTERLVNNGQLAIMLKEKAILA